MCGRYATTRTATDLSALFEALDITHSGVAVDYNVAPTDPVPVVRISTTHQGRVVDVARWGLVPPWATDRKVGSRMINARVETVATARAYARPFAVRRCLVPATGWYEFAPSPAGGRRKQPYFITPADGGVVAFAGLWSVWGQADEKLLTCTIVTTPAIGELADVHDRMPLVLSPERWAAWLTAPGDADGLLAPPSALDVAGLEIRAVGAAVGDVRNDGPDLIKALPGVPPLGTARHAAVPEPVDLTLF